jgi:hypothetical protein
MSFINNTLLKSRLNFLKSKSFSSRDESQNGSNAYISQLSSNDFGAYINQKLDNSALLTQKGSELQRKISDSNIHSAN